MSARNVRPLAVIGSTARDLPAHLRETLDTCLRWGIIPVMLEHPSADEPGAVEAALGLLNEADVYIGVFGDSYGRVLPNHDRSLGEMEYDRASERGIPRLVFLTSLGHPRPAFAAVTGGEENEARLAAFIGRVKEEQAVSEVESPEELGALLHDGLAELGIRGEAPAGFKGPAYKQVLRVFVASPGDVQDERSRMPKVVESLNKTLGKLLNVVVELWRWEADAAPAVGEPQALINPELDAADVVLVIFWNRFGTPTAADTTGTEEEVLRSLQRWGRSRRPQVMVYFCQRPASLGRAALEQRLKLLDFRERISSLVLAADYEDAREFEWRVRDDLFTTLARLCVKRK